MDLMQEPKYLTGTVDDNGNVVEIDAKLINRESGKPIPDDEPVFVLRAQDRHALDTLRYYASCVEDEGHEEVVHHRIHQFANYAQGHATKEPDTGQLILDFFKS